MNDQVISMVVGFTVVVGLRLLDWAFPRGYIWKKVREWSVPAPQKGRDSDEE